MTCIINSSRQHSTYLCVAIPRASSVNLAKPCSTMQRWSSCSLSSARERGGDADAIHWSAPTRPSGTRLHDTPISNYFCLNKKNRSSTWKLCYSGHSSLSLPRAQTNQPPSAFQTRFFLSRSLPLQRQVLQRNEPSGLEQDAQAAVDLLTDRVKFAAKRVACMSDTVVRFRDARGRSKAEEALAMSQACLLYTSPSPRDS